MSLTVTSPSNDLCERQGFCSRRQKSGFTLLEILVVIAIITILAVLALPAVTSMSGAGSMTTASYTVSGAIQFARSYAMAHDTYTWVGFFEEDGTKASANPAQAGVGRIVISTVASTDGTMIYSSTASAPVYIDPTRLAQVSKLTRILNAHLKSYSNGSGTGTTFATRPPLASANGRIGDTAPPSAALPYFQYPVGGAGAAQYTFTNVLQFSPRGEVLASGMAGLLTPLIEVGLQPANGDVANINSQNLIALQVAGISGNVTLYRQ
jgi:prepilin-type N-terminal cleavage/methylation domain-containing protein